jgi:hypothetical protein
MERHIDAIDSIFLTVKLTLVFGNILQVHTFMLQTENAMTMHVQYWPKWPVGVPR